MSLSIDSLIVTSFQTGDDIISPIGEDTQYPVCIVYVTDCVPCD